MNHEKIQEWKKLITEQRASGSTVPEWCKTKQIFKNAYYYWMECINDTKRQHENAETTFAELPVWSISKEISPGIVLKWNELQIPLSSQREIPLVAELIKQLQKKC